jgi:hypothetical protein
MSERDVDRLESAGPARLVDEAAAEPRHRQNDDSHRDEGTRESDVDRSGSTYSSLPDRKQSERTLT